MVIVYDLLCEYKRNPIGIGIRSPRISWKLKSGERAVMQTAYAIEVSLDESFDQTIWHSGKVVSDQSVHVEISPLMLASRTRYYYRVKVWSNKGEESGWSDLAYWETGLLDTKEWIATWVSAPLTVIPEGSEQSPLLRRVFQLKESVCNARIYATALGLYELEINGERVGDQYFTPGWTNYKKRLQVQAYDVTAQLKAGGNVIGAKLGKGWYSGNLAWQNQKELYGKQLALLLQLHVEYVDGSSEMIGSDEEWRASGGPILMSELYHGETYDARLEQEGWSKTDYDDAKWHPVQTVPQAYDILVAQENDPVRKIDEMKPIELIRTPKGETVLDFGQNMVGWVRFAVRGEAGRTVEVQHAEVLDKEGNFYIDNMRSARVTLRYTLKGGDEECYEPSFTFQGFRYIRLIGFEEPVKLDDFTGVVLHTDMAVTGSFRCSDALINQLQHNIEWGLKGNFLDVPTDCPQRDERLGWTGDAQIFIRTALFLRQAAPFFTKWSRDLASEQRADGGVPFVVPHVLDDNSFSSSAWGDAAVIVPWTVYLAYGDKRILEEQYESMKGWISYIRSQGEQPYLWNTGFHFGDWLGLDSASGSYFGATDKDYIATAFYAYSTSLVQKAAAVLGRDEDAAYFCELYANIANAFTQEFVTPSGRLSVPTQTAQVLGLVFGLLHGQAKERAIDKLTGLLEDNTWHLNTGFVGTPYLNFVLSDNGRLDIAYRLLLQQDYPSWLYQVTKGATTIWEHWDGIKEDASFWSKDMNSFNHYAYGAIGDWMYRCIAGIDTSENKAGYKEVRIAPKPGGTLTWAEGRHESMYGEIQSHWTRSDDGGMTLKAVIPPNTDAEVVLPCAALQSLLESGVPLQEAQGITSISEGADGVVVKLGSGEYMFSWPYVPA